MARMDAMEHARLDEKSKFESKIETMTNQLSEANQRAIFVETAATQHSEQTEARLKERIRREMLFQSPVQAPASQCEMRIFVKDAKSGAQSQIHIHERDSIQVLRYKCDQAVVAFSNAYIAGKCKISHDGVELAQLGALLVEYNVAENAVLSIEGISNSGSVSANRGVIGETVRKPIGGAEAPCASAQPGRPSQPVLSVPILDTGAGACGLQVPMPVVDR
jgi:hypothetical protein